MSGRMSAGMRKTKHAGLDLSVGLQTLANAIRGTPKSASRRPAHTRGQSPRGRVEEGGGGCTARLEGGPRRDLRHGLSRIDVKVAAPVFGRNLQPPPPSLGSMRRQPHTAAPRRPGHPRARRPAGGPCTRRAAPTAPARAAPGHS